MTSYSEPRAPRTPMSAPRSPGHVIPTPPETPLPHSPRRLLNSRHQSTGGWSVGSSELVATGSKPLQGASGSTRLVKTKASEGYVCASLMDKPLKVSDLDQHEQATSWSRRPLYYTHHRKPQQEQLSQVIRLPPMQQQIQFTASEGASWDRISENAFQASQKCSGRRLTIVVLLYCLPCNPFHLGDVDVLKRARASLDALDDVAVVGALVVPFGDAALKDRGTSEDRRLPFTLRRDLTRTVLRTAQQDSWVIVDTCLGTAPDQARVEGCMQHVSGSIAPFVSVYARGRLHGREHDIRVVEVRSEEPIEGSHNGRPYDQVHVSPGKSTTCPRHGPGGDKLWLASVGTLVIDMPKQSQCDDLIWSTVKHPQDKQLFLALERFCGSGAARMIADWSNKKISTQRRKTKLLG